MARSKILKLWPVVMGGKIVTKSVTIDNSTNANELTNYPVKMTVPYYLGMAVNFSNIRFRDTDNSILPHWIETYITSVAATVWVKVPSIPALSTKAIELQYGKLPNTSNGDNVFDLFDHFDRVLGLQATNAATVSINTAGYWAENIVYDADTNKYWWVIMDSTTTPVSIRLASCDDIANPVWSVEPTPVITDSVNLECPHIVKFGSTWYIYYGRNNANIYCQSSPTVNSGYSAAGISNPVIPKGGAGTWDANRTFEPYVFQVGSIYYHFYMGETQGTLIETVGYATAASPIGPFTKYAGNPVLTGDTGLWDGGSDKAADPFVFEKDGIYYVGVSATPTGYKGLYGKIGFFTTTDFITFTPFADNPVLGLGATIDNAMAIRGAVSLFGGVYYFPYIAYASSAKPALTALNFDQAGKVNRRYWGENVAASIANSLVTLSGGSAYLESDKAFGQGYAFRTRSLLHATTISILGFRDKTGSPADLAELVGCLHAGKTEGYNHNAVDAGPTANLGVPGTYAVLQIARNGSTSTLFSVNDGAAEELTTEVPDASIRALLWQNLICDWVLVRKYSYPEPTAIVG